MPETVGLRVATYNIHKGRGLDGRDRVDRIAAVLAEIGADVVGLQEVFLDQVPRLAEATGMHAAFGPTRRLPRGPYGNLCLSRFPLVAHERYDLTCRAQEPRGCLRVDLDPGHRGLGPLHVFNAHLGLGYRERVRQARLLTRICGRRRLSGPRLLLGDFNEWFHGRASRLLGAEFDHAGARGRAHRTHPSPLPVFRLDRIYHDAAVRLERQAVHRSRLARVASDHLPAYADLRIVALPPAHGPRA